MKFWSKSEVILYQAHSGWVMTGKRQHNLGTTGLRKTGPCRKQENIMLMLYQYSNWILQVENFNKISVPHSSHETIEMSKYRR
jgi:hypothetical protein